MKTTRTQIRDLEAASVSELSDEQLVQVSGGTVTFGSTSYTASWDQMDVDSPSYDDGGHSLF